MALLDSSIIIYSCQTNFRYLKPLVLDVTNCFSHISMLEVPGFSGIKETEIQYFEFVFKILMLVPIDKSVIDKAIDLHQEFKMKSNDSIIAASALINNTELYTRNIDDFKNVTGLKVINPVRSH